MSVRGVPTVRRRLSMSTISIGAAVVLAVAATAAWAAIPRASVGALQLKPRAVTAAKLASNAVSSTSIRNGSIATVDLKNGAVASSKLAGGAVGSAQLADGAITSAKLAAGAVGSAQLAAGAVASSNLSDGAVTGAKLADGAVTGAKLSDGSVTSAKLAAGSVGTTALADGAVTGGKLAALPRVVLTRTASEAILTDDATVVIPWDQEIEDPLGWHAPGSTTVVVDRAGIYLIEAVISIWHGDALGMRGVYLSSDSGTNFYANETQAAVPTTAGGVGSRNQFVVTKSMRLNAGATIIVNSIVDTNGAGAGGTAATLDRVGGYPTPSFTVTWIGN